MFFKHAKKVCKCGLFLAVILIIPMMNPHFRIDTDSYCIYYNYDGRLSTNQGGGYVIRFKYPAAYILFENAKKSWESEHKSVFYEIDCSGFGTSVKPFLSTSVGSSDIKKRLVSLDKEPYEEYLLWARSKVNSGYPIAAIPDIDHLYDFEMPSEFKCRDFFCTTPEYGIQATSPNCIAKLYVIGSDYFARIFGDYHKNSPISLEMIEGHFIKQGREFFTAVDTSARKKALIYKTTANGIGFFIDQGYQDVILLVALEFIGGVPDILNEWYLRFGLKKCFL